jgi:hypothetical protein
MRKTKEQKIVTPFVFFQQAPEMFLERFLVIVIVILITFSFYKYLNFSPVRRKKESNLSQIFIFIQRGKRRKSGFKNIHYLWNS